MTLKPKEPRVGSSEEPTPLGVGAVRTTFCLATSLVWAVETVLFEEDFEDVTLKPSIMEQVKDNKV